MTLHTFFNEYYQIYPDYIKNIFRRSTSLQIKEILNRCTNISWDEFLRLISPAGEDYLGMMAQKACKITRQHFGNCIQMYAPLYLSNECCNWCLYCGFNLRNSILRKTLSIEELIREATFLKREGFQHILLVSGEHPKRLPGDYFRESIQAICHDFPFISIEINPMSVKDYKSLIAAGASGLTVYQETYQETCYREVHPKGPKHHFLWRLETPDRGGEAGFRKIGIGILLGLADWRLDAAYLARHAKYLMKKYWRSQISISFPRLRHVPGGFDIPYPVTDREMVQLITALRLFLPRVGLTLSTREAAEFRNELLLLGITDVSAGSRTSPGGYNNRDEAGEQFTIEDHRSPEEVAAFIRQVGCEPVWKDWERIISKPTPKTRLIEENI